MAKRVIVCPPLLFMIYFNNVKQFQSAGENQLEELLEEIEPTKMNIDMDKMKQMFEQAKLINLRKQEDRRRQTAANKAANTAAAAAAASRASTNLRRENSGPGGVAGSNQQSPQEFSNLSSFQNEKISNLVIRYKKFNPTVNLTGPDKKRMEVREKFFEYIVYGLLEMEESEDILNEEEKRLVRQDPYEIARKLAVEIESNIFNVNNRSNKYALTDSYKQRCKLLFQNLKDTLNFNLRRSIINKSTKPITLCSMTEIELYNPTKLKEIEEQKMKILDRDTISLTDKMYILKTSKGEEIIAYKENQTEGVVVDDKTGEPSVTKDTVIRANSEYKGDSATKKVVSMSELFTLKSTDKIETKSHSKNPFLDQSIIDSLMNFIGEKSIKRIKDRLISDLPEIEAAYLLEKLAC